MSREDDAIVVCGHCGQAHRWRGLEPGTVARCKRCEATLGTGHRLSIRAVLALTITAAAAFAIGLGTDVLELRLRSTSANLLQAIGTVWEEGDPVVAVLAALTAVVAPAFFIGLRLYVLLPLSLGRKPAGFALAVRGLRLAGRWNLVSVFTIGVLLSLVKLGGMADAVPGPGLLAFGVATLLFAAIESAGLKHLWWQVR